jgi:hypothetical protein
MGEIQLEGYLCEGYGHIWASRETINEELKVCPKCKDLCWNIPRRGKVT